MISLTFVDVLSEIAHQKLEVGIHLSNGEAFLMERPTIVMYESHLTGVNWFGGYPVSISYQDIAAIDGCDIDVDVDEYGIASAIPYPIMSWDKTQNKPMKFKLNK